MAIRIASGRKTSMSKLQYRQMAISDDTEEVFIGTPSKYMKLLDEKDKKALETAIDNVEVDTSGLATKPELNTVTAALADTSKEVKSVKRSYSKMEPSFCIVDDDIRPGVYTKLKAIADKYKIKLTLAVITGQFGREDRMSKEQVLDMYNQGHELISHTHNHRKLDEIPESEVEMELLESKRVLNEMGIDVKSIAYPNGQHNQFVVEQTRKHYEYAMQSVYTLNYRPLNTYSLGRLGVGSWGFTEWEAVKSRIDECIRTKTLCIIMTHIDDTPADKIPLIEQTIEYIQSLGYKIETLSEAYEKHKNILEYGEFDMSSKKMSAAIGADGAFGGNTLGIYTGKMNEYKNSNPINDFKSYYITHNLVNTAESTGLPRSVGGLLSTYKLSGSFDYTYQTFKPYSSNRQYMRRWHTTNNTWTEWEEIAPKIINFQADDSVSSSTLPPDFTAGMIHYCQIGYSNRTGFPTNDQGLLITNKLKDSSLHAFQEFQSPTNNLVYRRVGLSATSWSEWQLINAVTVLPSTGVTTAKPLTEFSKGQITHTAIGSANSSGFPEDKGGLLTTYRIGSDDFGYQEYKIVKSNNRYERYWTGTAWGDWKQYTIV